MENSKKILVLMSGGVDSSTAAALLKESGHEVAGVYLKLYEEGALGEECWAKEMQDAARVAVYLGIPFQVWDVTADYKKRVLENFYSEYGAGRTPNPDVLCNSEIKFGVGLERALKAGYEYVATGHYARLRSSQSTVHSSQHELVCGVDKNKDQSYFLWRLTQRQLEHVLFPIGEYTKPQVRALAEKFGLHNAQKKDSQGVCFLGKIDLKEFLRANVEEKSGPIVDVQGNLLGYHDGLAHFTIGQREGTRLGGTGPYYVVGKDVEANTLVVAHEEDEPQYRVAEVTVGDMNWIVSAPPEGTRLVARTRYRAPLVSVTIRGNSVIFDEPARAIAPGQSIVFYDGNRAVGGGIIDKVSSKNLITPKIMFSKAYVKIQR